MKHLIRPALVLIVFMTLCSLGIWQVKRLYWKQDLIAQLTDRQNLPARSLRDFKTLPLQQDLEYMSVADIGHLDTAHPLFIQSTLNGSIGWRVLAPFTTENGISVLVDLGTAASRDIHLKPQTEIKGLVRKHSSGRSTYDLDNDPGANIWLWWDLPAMQKAAGLTGEVAPFAVQAFSNSSGLIPHEARIELRNQHLGYAITWFGLAAALVSVACVFVFKRNI